VRIGNEASGQFQLDVFGEVLDASWTGIRAGLFQRRADLPVLRHDRDALLPSILGHLEAVWDQPDDGIWEVRGQRRHFTHSKVMAWTAFDRGVRLATALGADDLPVDRWAELRDTIHHQVCEQGWNAEKGTFVQYYGADIVDASLLMMARVGFLPASDPRIVATVDAIQRDLLVDGFVLRYPTGEGGTDDGLPPGEGAFLMTTFWLVDNLALIGRTDEARAMFEHLRGLRNDVGLLSEEYDPKAERMLGNFPQAFSHLGLIISAANLSLGVDGPFGDQLRRDDDA
jgi:GH15 family glucan-1,4-alpha-glucosidase